MKKLFFILPIILLIGLSTNKTFSADRTRMKESDPEMTPQEQLKQLYDERIEYLNERKERLKERFDRTKKKIKKLKRKKSTVDKWTDKKIQREIMKSKQKIAWCEKRRKIRRERLNKMMMMQKK